MRIAIDISQVVYGTGVSVYTKSLVSNLLMFGKENEYILFGGYLRRKKDLDDFTAGLKGNFFTRFFPIPPTFADFIWNRLHLLKIEKLIGNIDVFHSSDWSQPPSNCFKVSTIHDLIPIKYPNFSSLKLINAHKRRLFWVKNEANKVIVPSIQSRKDLISVGFSQNKIVVIPEASNERIKKVGFKEIAQVKRKFRVSGKYLLSIGVTPRKNTENIVKAYEKVKTEAKVKLVLVGHSHYKIKETHGVIVTGHISDDDLSALYTGAEALVYPSLYEGFGIPILDAFKCNIPVVTSNVGSMKEIANGAAILVEPTDINSIVDGINKALENRKVLVRKGIERLNNYSWKKTAEKTIEVYKEGLIGKL